MPKFRCFLLFFLALVAIHPSGAQNLPDTNLWPRLDHFPLDRAGSNIWVRPAVFGAFQLNHGALREILGRAPKESAQPAAFSQTLISLPMPDGTVARFRFVESPVMAPELAAKFPEIKTYLGQGIDDPLATVRFDLTPAGFHAQILSPHGAVYVDPYFRGDPNFHAAYYKRDYQRAADGFQCLTASGDALSLPSEIVEPLTVSGGNLRTYRLACAATGEYTQFHGGTVSAGMAAIVTAINRVTGVYETEVAIRLVLVANNDLIVYTNPNTDPYNNSSGSTMLNQNQANLDAVIGSGNYDIGHVFSTGGGGIAGLGVVCVSGRKANGVTGLTAPIGDAFYIDYVAHEMGHQFGANHPFNSSTGNCGGGNRNGSTAYEPGSGSTIMAYAGICGADDLQSHSDPYFHSVSLDEIINYSTLSSGNGCALVSVTGNSTPTIGAGANFTIPKGTPFSLTATGNDPNGDTLTYCWEERDLGPSITLTTPDNGSSPLFRSFNPTLSSSRTFPKFSDILNHTVTLGEMLPTTSRTLNFRVVARDNRAGGGGINTADMHVTVVTNAGPFVVTSPNTAVTWSNLQTVTWNVAGTTASPVNTANVNILLSTNSGQSFPIVLASNVPNSGAQIVQLPNLASSTARIKVEAAGNIFFDISDANFSIAKTVIAPLVTLESATLVSEGCVDNAVDPGERVTVNFALRNAGTANTTNLVVTLSATNGITAPSAAQSYGALATGGPAASHPFTFTAAGTCGGSIAAVLLLEDGGQDLGTLTVPFDLGTIVAATFSQTNSGAIEIPAAGNTKGIASPYPSTVSVSGITGLVSKVTVTLNGVTHPASDDIDVLLVGPSGQTVLLMSDAGSSANNATLTFDDGAAASLPSSGPISSGAYKPTNIDTSSDNFAAPAPAGPFGQTLSAFNGLDANGAWSLYAQDDFKQSAGSIAQGWTLTITTSNATCCFNLADLTIGESVAPSLVSVGNNLTYTLTVTNLGPMTANSVTVTDALPANVSFVSAAASQGTSLMNNSGLVCFALGSLSNTATATMSMTVSALSPGGVTNRVWVSGNEDDPNGLNNSAHAIAWINALNHAPVLAGQADRTIHAGSVLTVSNAATDVDLPIDTLSFSLLEGAPAGATIDAGTGLLTWRTSDADANTTNIFTVRVTDNGWPSLSDEKSFQVSVVARPAIESITVTNEVVTIEWTAIAGQTYRVQYKEGLSDTNWNDLPTETRATGAMATKTDAIGPSGQRVYRVRVME